MNKLSEEIVLRWIRNGNGQGEGKSFNPFFNLRCPSMGMATAFLGIITGRIHVALSLLEYKHLVLYEFETDISDIREQFALLPRGETEQIARDLGIRHPLFRGTRIPTVPTSDLVVTRATAIGPERFVVAIKYFVDVDIEGCDLKTRKRILRTLDKLALERSYWVARQVPWHLSTDLTIPENRFRNLDMFRPTMIRRDATRLDPHIPDFVELVTSAWEKKPWITLNQLFELSSCALGITAHDSFTLFGRALWRRELSVDIDTEPMHHLRPIRLLAV